jgi:hypothetical protein
MPQLNYNTSDALQQERIRRGPHEFAPGPDGKNIYQTKIHQHQEYPKVMDRTPAPKLSDKDFKGKPDAPVLLEQAMKEWEAGQTASIVHNKAEEERWLKAHGEKAEPENAQEAAPDAPAAKKGRRAA